MPPRLPFLKDRTMKIASDAVEALRLYHKIAGADETLTILVEPPKTEDALSVLFNNIYVLTEADARMTVSTATREALVAYWTARRAALLDQLHQLGFE